MHNLGLGHVLVPSTDVIQLTLTLGMTTTQVVETSVTVNNISPMQECVHLDDQTQPTYEMTPGFKPGTVSLIRHLCLDGHLSKMDTWSWPLPSFSHSLYLTLCKTDVTFKRTLRASPKGVHLREI